MIETVIDIAETAGELILKYYKKDYEKERKSDVKGDFVTTADHEADAFIRERLSQEFQGYDILSEENSDRNADFSKKVWVVDPIDGTYVFTLGEDSFAVMIGLCEEGSPTLGVIHFPVKGETLYASKGSGAYLRNAEGEIKLETSSRGVDEAILRGKKPYSIKKYWEAVVGDFDFETYDPGNACSARNCADIVIGKADFTLFGKYQQKWDMCAPEIIVKEAGGNITDIDGNDLDYSYEGTALNNIMLVSNGTAHEELLKKLN